MKQSGLYDPRFEQDACGIGAVARIDGMPDHAVLYDALTIVEQLGHRAGTDAEGDTGDGVGVLTQIPHALFSAEAEKLGIRLGEARDYGVGMFFFRGDTEAEMRRFERAASAQGLVVLGWRVPPTTPGILGAKALDCMPAIMQCFIERPDDAPRGLPFEQRLFVARRSFEQKDTASYVVSLSSRTIVYKGMFLVTQLRAFYDDLQNPAYATAFAAVHARFSTNTFPSWERAHPNRVLLHNGEINTIRGNADRMAARSESMASPLLSRSGAEILPVIRAEGSDSAMLDNTVEFLMMNGMPLPLAMMALVPEPWGKLDDQSAAERDLFHYYATLMEPWDGPAGIVYADGDLLGATLDRNGLRPVRYVLTTDGRLVLSSEAGALPMHPEIIARTGRLGPGQMLLVDLAAHRFCDNAAIKADYAARQPYGEWLAAHLTRQDQLPEPKAPLSTLDLAPDDRLLRAFGYTYDDVREVILPMAQNGLEPTASMGIDIPLAVLSEQHPLLYDYFKQRFAQVTNPPIDAIREQIVTDTRVYVGPEGNLLEEKPNNCAVLELDSPVLTHRDFAQLCELKKAGFQAAFVSICYKCQQTLSDAVTCFFARCDAAFRDGANLLILSDRDVTPTRMPMPSLLAVSALEQHLIREKTRTKVSVVIESGEARSVHHIALLLGYGARAVYPYLAHACVRALFDRQDPDAAVVAYNRALTQGVLKIASKMGISTLQSYQSAQIFEAIGLSAALTDRHFTNTVSRIGGIGLAELDADVRFRHKAAYTAHEIPGIDGLTSIGAHKLRSSPDAETHLYNPKTIALLQQAVRTADDVAFEAYTRELDEAVAPHTLRGLLSLRFDPQGGVPLSSVESVESIVQRFKTGAMSYGSLSREAHECLAKAMNALGGRSNSGEGGEDPERLNTDVCSAIKQVASGRFGVTLPYLLSASEIQIKMAQGAKPGEGGHLPGGKVYPWVAKTRHATPGVALISPPPHHDIYSIEDLTQLIFDLKNANPRARICVKLVSESGVGTVAAGVAKAGAQGILISGYDGGTGAAPRSSIHHAGLPWELGLAEAHQTLLKNGLRGKVVLETDGKLMTGRDVAVACLLGAEEFGFATAPLVAMGCVMMRACNLDTCPVGIATQNPALRACFAGKPEYVMTFMRMIAAQLRQIMAKLGVRSLDEMVGRTDLLEPSAQACATHGLDLSAILAGGQANWPKKPRRTAEVFPDPMPATLRALLESGGPGTVCCEVRTSDRAFGTYFGQALYARHGDTLPDDWAIVCCTGSAGQSFGAFLPKGVTLSLCGEANDYVGKGLSGGKITLYPPQGLAEQSPILAGNVALYGATAGSLYLRGQAGERFCVRNSGATAVSEGVGNHGCEYMTGGCAVILGPIGHNFAAGMSGGVAYVLDEAGDSNGKINPALVRVLPLNDPAEAESLRALLVDYEAATHSPKARAILANFSAYCPMFLKIIPTDYQLMKAAIDAAKAEGLSDEDAKLRAFQMRTTRKEG